MQPNDHTAMHRSDDDDESTSQRTTARVASAVVGVRVLVAGTAQYCARFIRRILRSKRWVDRIMDWAQRLRSCNLASAFKYFTFRYSIVAGELVVQHGLIFRQHRTIPIGRIQNIDMVQNPLHRWFDVGEVRIETASGKEPEAIMRVLAVPELRRLQSNVFGTVRRGSGFESRCRFRVKSAGRRLEYDACSPQRDFCPSCGTKSSANHLSRFRYAGCCWLGFAAIEVRC
jgi:membrane protein YdbS with pleckstrin-like domain